MVQLSRFAAAEAASVTAPTKMSGGALCENRSVVRPRERITFDPLQVTVLSEVPEMTNSPSGRMISATSERAHPLRNAARSAAQESGANADRS